MLLILSLDLIFAGTKVSGEVQYLQKNSDVLPLSLPLSSSTFTSGVPEEQERNRVYTSMDKLLFGDGIIMSERVFDTTFSSVACCPVHRQWGAACHVRLYKMEKDIFIIYL